MTGGVRAGIVVATGMSGNGRRVSAGTHIGDHGWRWRIVGIRRRFFSPPCSPNLCVGGTVARSTYPTDNLSSVHA